jgi:hypothetical protein
VTITVDADLVELSRPFPTDFVERKDGQDYVAHHVVNQRLLSIVGPFDFELVEVIRGDVAAVPPDPGARSRRGKAGTSALHNVVVGGIWRLTVTVDGRQVRVEEVGAVVGPGALLPRSAAPGPAPGGGLTQGESRRLSQVPTALTTCSASRMAASASSGGTSTGA